MRAGETHGGRAHLLQRLASTHACNPHHILPFSSPSCHTAQHAHRFSTLSFLFLYNLRATCTPLIRSVAIYSSEVFPRYSSLWSSNCSTCLHETITGSGGSGRNSCTGRLLKQAWPGFVIPFAAAGHRWWQVWRYTDCALLWPLGDVDAIVGPENWGSVEHDKIVHKGPAKQLSLVRATYSAC